MVRLMSGILAFTLYEFRFVVLDLFLVIKGVSSENKRRILCPITGGGEPTVIGGWVSYAFTFHFFQSTSEKESYFFSSDVFTLRPSVTSLIGRIWS